MRRAGPAAPPPALPEGAAKRRSVEAMFDRVAARYDRMNRIISLGLDRAWRRRAVRALALPPGSTVLDLACGTGDLCEELAARGHRPVGFDLSAGMLGAAHTGAPLVRADVLELPVPDAAADGVISGFALRNLVDLDRFFAECARVVRPGGRLVALDAGEPHRRVLRAGHRLWFRRIVPLLGARLSSDPDAYRYLPRSTAYLPDPDRLVAALGAAGFTAVERRELTGGAVQVLAGTRA